MVYKCRNLGCVRSFTWSMQLYRHMEKCTYQKPVVEPKYVKSSDGEFFRCQGCSKTFSKQPNVIRHLKICKGEQAPKPKLACGVCSKEFAYKSLLQKHLISHRDRNMQCQVCYKTFTRKDHFNRHTQSCKASEEFVPSFATDDCFNAENPLNSTSVFENNDHVEQVVPEMDSISDEIFEPSVNNELFVESNPESMLPSTSRSSYWKPYRQAKEKASNLESIIQSLSSPVKRNVKRRLADSVLSDVIVHADASNVHEATVVTNLIDYLKELNKKRLFPKLHETMNQIFKDKMTDQAFLKWLANKLDIRPARFIMYVSNWRARNFEESRGGHNELPLETKQAIYDTWIDHCISSTDGRNGRNVISIKRRKYNAIFQNISHKTVQVNTVVNKRGSLIYQANRMVLTCTVREIQEKIMSKGLSVSLGAVLGLKPFFITFPSDKEIALCLCKLCLNVRLMMQPLITKAKSDNDEAFQSQSASKFFMSSCKCDKGVNGYHQWKCVNGKCKECKTAQPIPLTCQSSQEKVKYYQFERTETNYTKLDKVTKEPIQKVSIKTEKVEKETTYAELYQQLCKRKKEYVIHKYEVFNDIYHWPFILNTTSTIGPVYHMDFSENLSQMYKYEPQSSHFSKTQYSLHCTVKHEPYSENKKYQYIYHLSDEMRHDYAFTSAVVDHLLSLEAIPDIIRFKSDNCSTQYKSKYVFSYWSSLAKSTGKKCLIYYGVSGHGKGLVDAMSGFGVKGPIRKAVVTQDFSFKSATDIHDYLTKLFEHDSQKQHYLLAVETITEKQNRNTAIKINGCRKLHMICYFPDGSVQTKQRICSCQSCLVGEFDTCIDEKGLTHYPVQSNEESSSSCDSSDTDDTDEEELENYEMRSSSVVEIVKEGNIIALYAPPNSFELFYLCKVLALKVAEEDVFDDYNHPIAKNTKYLECQYLEKSKEMKGKVRYKLLSRVVFVLPGQVMNPLVNLNSDLELSIEEYQWLSDSI